MCLVYFGNELRLVLPCQSEGCFSSPNTMISCQLFCEGGVLHSSRLLHSGNVYSAG